MDVPQFVYPLSVDGHVVCFHHLAIMNSVAMNIIFFFLFLMVVKYA